MIRTGRGPGDSARRARFPGGRGSAVGLLARGERLGARIEMVAPSRKDRDRVEWVSFSDRGVREGPGKWVEFLDPYACDFLCDLRARESCPLRCPGTSLARRVDLRRRRKRGPPWGTVDGRQDNHRTMSVHPSAHLDAVSSGPRRAYSTALCEVATSCYRPLRRAARSSGPKPALSRTWRSPSAIQPHNSALTSTSCSRGAGRWKPVRGASAG